MINYYSWIHPCNFCLIPTGNYLMRYDHYTHLTDEETEAQKSCDLPRVVYSR